MSVLTLEATRAHLRAGASITFDPEVGDQYLHVNCEAQPLDSGLFDELLASGEICPAPVERPQRGLEIYRWPDFALDA